MRIFLLLFFTKKCKNSFSISMIRSGRSGSFHLFIQHIDAGQQDEQRINQCHDHLLLTSEERDEMSIGVRENITDHKSYRIVGPVECYTGQNTACTVIHPAEKSSYQKGMRHLCGIEVDDGE